MPTRTIYLFDDLGNKVAVGTYESAPVSLTVGGSWTNTQYTGSAPDPTGLTFTCTFSDGTSSSVVPTSVSPSTWSSAAGTQTATFSYTAGGVTVNGSKSVSVEQKILYVGGTIIYINTYDADGTYTFYNAQGTQVSAPSLDTDCTGWTYTVTGATKPKYMVYSGSIINNKWGYNGVTITGADTFDGKADTEAILAITPQDSDCIWSDLRTMRANRVNGCDDWYIGAFEYGRLEKRSSSVVNSLYSNYNRIWTSYLYEGIEDFRARYMYPDGPAAYGMSDFDNRTVVHHAIPIRTF